MDGPDRSVNYPGQLCGQKLFKWYHTSYCDMYGILIFKRCVSLLQKSLFINKSLIPFIWCLNFFGNIVIWRIYVSYCKLFAHKVYPFSGYIHLLSWRCIFWKCLKTKSTGVSSFSRVVQVVPTIMKLKFKADIIEIVSSLFIWWSDIVTVCMTCIGATSIMNQMI